MPNTRKYKTETLIEIIDKYIEKKAGFQRIQFVDLAAFCEEEYPLMAGKINYQFFSRNKEIREYIENYNISLERRLLDKEKTELVVQDRLLDSRDLYGKSNDEIDSKVSEINQFLSKTYAFDRKIAKSYQEKINRIRSLSKENKDIIAATTELKEEIQELKNTLKKERTKNNELAKKIKKISKYMNDMDNIAVVAHLKELGIIDIEQMDSMVDKELAEKYYGSVLTKGESDAVERLAGL